MDDLGIYRRPNGQLIVVTNFGWMPLISYLSPYNYTWRTVDIKDVKKTKLCKKLEVIYNMKERINESNNV